MAESGNVLSNICWDTESRAFECIQGQIDRLKLQHKIVLNCSLSKGNAVMWRTLFGTNRCSNCNFQFTTKTQKSSKGPFKNEVIQKSSIFTPFHHLGPKNSTGGHMSTGGLTATRGLPNRCNVIRQVITSLS